MRLFLLLAAAASAPTINVHASRYGPIAFDRRGFALHAFTLSPLALRRAIRSSE